MVKDKIKKIVSEMGRLHFIYDDWARTNIRLDNEQLPAFVFVLPASGQMHLKNNSFRDAPDCLFAFLSKAEFDFDGEENELTVDKMKKEAQRFIVALQKSGMFEPITDPIDYTVAFDELDVNLTGVVLSLRIKEVAGSCVNTL